MVEYSTRHDVTAGFQLYSINGTSPCLCINSLKNIINRARSLYSCIEGDKKGNTFIQKILCLTLSESLSQQNISKTLNGVMNINTDESV